MKASDIIVAYATKNNCYKANKRLTPKGIVVHSTGANNPFLRRYVDSPKEVGSNAYGNHWNNPTPDGRSVCVHAFIGKDINNKVRVAQILPYNIQCWGCGSGSKGSYNTSHIQFEICEDALTCKAYFDEAFKAAAEYCAYLCHNLGLDITTIVSHAEAHKKGYASNHGDCDHWLKRFGKTMNDFRAEVKKVYESEYAKVNYADIVCKKCGFTAETRKYLDAYTYSTDLWRKLYERMN